MSEFGRPSGRTGETIGGVISGLIVGGFGLLWTILAFSVTNNGPFVWVYFIFPLFGLLFVGVGIVVVVSTLTSAAAVNQIGTLEHPPATDADGHPSPPTKVRSLVQCECGEPFRVGGKFCTRCGKPTG